jgi:Ca2+/Na+ antiporter
MSILWIWAIAKILIDILEVTGILLNIPATFLGMTLLSFGNSVPDLTLNCALAKSGYGEMGIAGSVAGPLFNLLIGLGASLIKKTIIEGEVEFNLFKYTHVTILIGISVLAFNLLRLLIHSFILKFSMTKSVSYIGYLLYFIFFVGICLFTFVFTTNPFQN